MSVLSFLDRSNPQAEAQTTLRSREIWIYLLVFVAYFLAGRLDMSLLTLEHGHGVVWIPTGIGLAAILLRGNGIAPIILVASFLVEITCGIPALAGLAIALGNTIEAVLGGYLVNRFAGGTKAFSRPANVLKYSVLAGALATLVSALVGASALNWTIAGTRAEELRLLTAWWAGHALGALVIAPFLVLLLRGEHHPLHLSEFAEMAALLLGLSVTCVVSFGPVGIFSDRVDTPLFLCVPFLVWVGIRFCPLEAAGACLVLCGFATWGSVHGYGPFTNSTAMPLSLATYICVATSMTLVGTATIAHHREVSEQLLENLYRGMQSKDLEIQRLSSDLEFFRDELIRRVHAKSRPALNAQAMQAMQGSEEVIWFLEAETENILYVSPSYEAVWGRSREELGRDVHAWLDAVYPEDREYALKFVGEDFPSDRQESTYRVRRPDGSLRWIYDRGFVIRDPSGRATRYLGLASDITELVKQGEVVPAQLEQEARQPRRDTSSDKQTRRTQG